VTLLEHPSGWRGGVDGWSSAGRVDAAGESPWCDKGVRDADPLGDLLPTVLAGVGGDGQ
jgi:hypothetical protein